MMTRMSATSGRWSMGLAVAILMAMTSTLSAQMQATGGMASPGSSVSGGTGSVIWNSYRPMVSSDDRAQLPGPITGTCGTDTTPKPGHVLAHDRGQQLFARQLHLAMSLFPSSHIALRILAYRMWIQSTVDVLPPG